MEIVFYVFYEFYFCNRKLIMALILAGVFDVFDIDTIRGIQIQRGNVIRNDVIPIFISARMLDYF